MKSLYGKFVLMTALIMLFSTIGGFLITNTYYHRVMKARNDEKNVEIAKTIVDHIEETPQVDLDEYFKTIGRIGYQLYVVDESSKPSFYGGEFRLKNLDKQSVKQVLEGHVYHGMRDFPRETFVTGFFANEMSNTIGVPLTMKISNTRSLFGPTLSCYLARSTRF